MIEMFCCFEFFILLIVSRVYRVLCVYKCCIMIRWDQHTNKKKLQSFIYAREMSISFTTRDIVQASLLPKLREKNCFVVFECCLNGNEIIGMEKNMWRWVENIFIYMPYARFGRRKKYFDIIHIGMMAMAGVRWIMIMIWVAGNVISL